MKRHPSATMATILGILLGWSLPGVPDGYSQATNNLPSLTKRGAFTGQTGMVLVVSQGKKGTMIANFVTTKNTPAKNKTTARVQWNETGLQVAFDCEDPRIVATNRPRDDQDLWRDDCVEIFLDIGHTHDEESRWVHIMLNAAGEILDERGPMRAYFTSGDPGGGNVFHTASGMVTRVAQKAGGWQAEIMLPWAALGGRPAPQAIWGFNLAREDHPAEEYSCYSPTYGSFYKIDQWGHIGFATAADAARDWVAAAALDHENIGRARAQKTELAAAFNGQQITSTQTWMEIGGKVYGAQPDERGPIGGGNGYRATVTGGQYRVSNLNQLVGALKQAHSGETVFVEGETEIDCTGPVCAEKLVLEIPGGVTLAGNRGVSGSPGALIYSDELATSPLFRVLGPNVRVTGLRIRGPDPKQRLDWSVHCAEVKNAKGDLYYKLPVAIGIVTEQAGLEVDNCELSGWSDSAIYLMAGDRHHIHHSYIHHNQRDGLGYGVCLGYGKKTEALIEQNLFNYNRHSIAATGAPGNSFEACHNVELGEALGHCFDMHGGEDRKDGTDIAGTWLKIHHNTFRARIRAIWIRGVPQEGAEIYQNWFLYCRPPLTPREEIMSLDPTLAVRTQGNTRIYDNAYSTVQVW